MVIGSSLLNINWGINVLIQINKSELLESREELI